MELILLVLILSAVFVLVLLWVKTDELSRRQDRAEQQVRDLQAALTKIRGTVGRLDATRENRAVQAAAAAPPWAAPSLWPVESIHSGGPSAPATARSGGPPRVGRAGRGSRAPGLRAGHLGRPGSPPTCRARDRGAHAPRARPDAARGR